MFLIWVLGIGMSSVGKTDCGHIKLHSSGESKRRTISSCTQFSQQQTASWLNGEGEGLMENMCLLGAVTGVWGESCWGRGAMESGPGHPGAMCVEQEGLGGEFRLQGNPGTQPLLRGRPGFAETWRHSDGFECLAQDKMKQPDSSLLECTRMRKQWFQLPEKQSSKTQVSFLESNKGRWWLAGLVSNKIRSFSP